jgi:hypothetical protein
MYLLHLIQAMGDHQNRATGFQIGNKIYDHLGGPGIQKVFDFLQDRNTKMHTFSVFPTANILKIIFSS